LDKYNQVEDVACGFLDKYNPPATSVAIPTSAPVTINIVELLIYIDDDKKYIQFFVVFLFHIFISYFQLI